MTREAYYLLYWCCWTVPFDVPLEHMLEEWPPRMQGWETGESDEGKTYAGAVWALGEKDAWATVESCYGPSAHLIGKRGEPAVKPDAWRPGDRFPGWTLKKPGRDR